jgi:hypothetical protein
MQTVATGCMGTNRASRVGSSLSKYKFILSPVLRTELWREALAPNSNLKLAGVRYYVSLRNGPRGALGMKSKVNPTQSKV